MLMVVGISWRMVSRRKTDCTSEAFAERLSGRTVVFSVKRLSEVETSAVGEGEVFAEVVETSTGTAVVSATAVSKVMLSCARARLSCVRAVPKSFSVRSAPFRCCSHPFIMCEV